VPAPDPPAGPDVSRIAELAEEFYRQQAIFPAAVVAREDRLLGVVAVHATQTLLYELLVACSEPLPAMGVKQWSAKLTPPQRGVLTRLPQPTADRDAVVAAMLEVRRAFRTTGRDAALAVGSAWPDDVDAAIERHWRNRGLAADG
jgi:hypothetical protein